MFEGGFSLPLPNVVQTIDYLGNELYHEVSLRRIYRNVNAQKNRMPFLDWAVMRGISALGFYSSGALVRDLRRSREIVDMMNASNAPFSVLGKKRTVDYSSPSGDVYIKTRPLIFIPEAKDMDAIMRWEARHTEYERERRILGVLPYTGKTTRRRYSVG
jgi:hypothetical protein